MKRILTLLTLVTMMAVLLVGCGVAANKSADQTKPTNLLEKVKASKKMVVGLMGTYPPYNFMNDKNEVDGFDADIAKEVAKRLGLTAEFVPTEWAGMIAGLDKSKFDIVISQMTITDERKKAMDFSQPYIKNDVNIIVKADNTTINSLNDLKGKKVGVGLGTNDETYLRDVAMPKVGKFEILTYNDVITSLLDVNNGRTDATVNNMFAIKPMIDKNNLKLKIVGAPIKEDLAGMAIRKGNPEFLQAIDKALADMKTDGTYKVIFKKWFGVDPTL